jgi:hypothetical protein
MATQFVKRFIIVARADLAAAANLAAKQPDTDPEGGDTTFTAGLSASGSAPAQAYWCSWQMTLAQASAIRTRLRERGATVAEVTPVSLNGSPASNRFAVFDSDDGWTPDLVLAKLGLQRVSAVTP